MDVQMIGLADTTDLNEATLESEANSAANNIRLNSLRQAALTILGELDSIKGTEAETVQTGSCSLRLYDEVRRFEINLIKSALSRTGGSQTHAARLLGVKLTTLNSKIKRYHIDFSPYHDAAEELRHESAA